MPRFSSPVGALPGAPFAATSAAYDGQGLDYVARAPDAVASGANDDGGHETESYASDEDGQEDYDGEGDDDNEDFCPDDIISTSPTTHHGEEAASTAGTQVYPASEISKEQSAANSKKAYASGKKATVKGKKNPKPVSVATARNEDTWNQRLEQLQQYHKEQGDFAVPRKYDPNPQLGYWVNEQRKQIMFWVRGQPSTLTQQRMGALFELGFPLPKLSTNPNPVLGANVVVPGAGDAWTTRLNELRLYRVECGDHAVPRKYEKNPQLGYWVNEQRKQFAFFLRGKKSTLTQARMRALYNIGFPFSVPKRAGGAVNPKATPLPRRPHCDSSKEANAVSAKRGSVIQQVEGDGQSPALQRSVIGSKYVEQSAAFVSQQTVKVEGMAASDGENTEAKAPVVSASTKQDVWDVRFAELQKFCKENGNCLVPQKYEPNKRLGLWVSQQRTQYRHWVNGDASSLTREKIRALKVLGFAWNGRSNTASADTSGGSRGGTMSLGKRSRVSSDQESNQAPMAVTDAAALISPLPSRFLLSTLHGQLQTNLGDERGQLLHRAQDMRAKMEAVQSQLRNARQENSVLRNQLNGVKGALADVLSAPS